MARSSLDPEHEQRILDLLAEAHEIADDDTDLKLRKAENKAALKKAYRKAGIEQALIVDGRIASVTLRPGAEEGPLFRADGSPIISPRAQELARDLVDAGVGYGAASANGVGHSVSLGPDTDGLTATFTRTR